MSVESKARDLLSTMTAGGVIKKVLGPDVARPQPLTKQAVNSVVKVFATVSQSAEGSKRLHDAAVKYDKTSIIDRLAADGSRTSALSSADMQFKTIVGEETYNRLKRELQNDSKLTEPQAKNVLAMASSAVVESIKSELGSVAGGASSISTLLKKTTSEPVAAAPATSTRTSSNSSVGQASVTQSETSSAMRFAPLLLLGVLTLGTIKYCSDSAKNKVVVEERGGAR